jgi:DNA helicase II / ATP-dependent DNA helicase PcrA
VADVLSLLKSLASTKPGHSAVVDALALVPRAPAKPNLMPAVAFLRMYADDLPDEQRREIYDDTEVLIGEWDQYLRTGAGSAHLAGFLSSLALGTTQLINADGVALLTVHSSKGLEFEVIFVAGMAEGIFPDYRAQGKAKETAEERRNAFVAVTRSKRLLYFSYPQTRRMPWGDVWRNNPSSYLQGFSKFLRR